MYFGPFLVHLDVKPQSFVSNSKQVKLFLSTFAKQLFASFAGKTTIFPYIIKLIKFYYFFSSCNVIIYWLVCPLFKAAIFNILPICTRQQTHPSSQENNEEENVFYIIFYSFNTTTRSCCFTH